MSEKVKIVFVEKGETKEFEVPVGISVLEVAHNNNINLEGACEGSMACSTCHVVVDKKFYDKLANIHKLYGIKRNLAEKLEE